MTPVLTRPAVTKVYAARPRVNAILDVYRLATVAELSDGLAWYPDAHALAVLLDPQAPRQAAGVIAALSPMMNWQRNMRLAIRAYEDGVASGALFRSVAKADAIMAGADPLDILGGNKVRNFFAAIADPESDVAVCIDRHAFDIAVGRVTNDVTRKALDRVGVYDLFANAYREAARRLTKETGVHITPAQVQAVTWVVWRRMKGITE